MNQTKTIYLAGPMTGRPQFNFPLFDSVRDILNASGWKVISPADLDREVGFDPDIMTVDREFLEAAMQRDLDAIMKVDAMMMLPDWRDSKGALAEFHLARWRHIPVYEWTGAYGVPLEESPKAAAGDPKKAAGDTPRPVVVLPNEATERKKYPVYSGVFKYFPNALLLVARQSWEGNNQHHPGTPLHWDMSKSADEPDALGRHLLEDELVAVAWRALANLERAALQGYNPFTAQSQ